MVISQEKYAEVTDYLKNIEALAANYFGSENVSFENTTYQEMLKRILFWNDAHSITQSSNNEGPENRAECCNRFIYIRWQNLVVENEISEKTIIPEFYVTLRFSAWGQFIDFLMTTTTFTESQIQAYYNHSHVPMLSSARFAHFSSPCLGQGPIRNTIATLRDKYKVGKNKQFDFEPDWLFFFTELDTYVHTESLSGGPYIRLNRIGSSEARRQQYCTDNIIIDSTSYAQDHSNNSLQTFLEWYLPQSNIKPLFYYNDRSSINISLGHYSTPIYIEITEKLHQYIQTFPERKEDIDIYTTVCEYDESTDTFYYAVNNPQEISREYSTLNRAPVFIFKDQIVYQKVIKNPILTPSVNHKTFKTFTVEAMSFILSQLLLTFNLALLKNEFKRENTIFL